MSVALNCSESSINSFDLMNFIREQQLSDDNRHRQVANVLFDNDFQEYLISQAPPVELSGSSYSVYTIGREILGSTDEYRIRQALLYNLEQLSESRFRLFRYDSDLDSTEKSF